jgi:isocitrate dehydrogenase (NAD+)
VGGLGFAPAGNIGLETSMFEAVHGSAPDIAGRGIANPTGLLLSACMMLDHLHMSDASHRIRDAVDRVLRGGEVRTADMGGGATTADYTAAVARALG